MQRHTVQNIGWYGVIAILLAYGLLSFHVLTPESLWYLLLNLTGATAIAYEAWSKHDRQPLVLNVIWALVAIASIIRLCLI
jgi:hypothetical protein